MSVLMKKVAAPRNANFLLSPPSSRFKAVSFLRRMLSFTATAPPREPWVEEETLEEEKARVMNMDSRTGEPRRGKNWNYDTELFAFANRLNFKLTDVPSIRTALTHRSYLFLYGEKPEVLKIGHNGRLANLGLSTVIQFVQEYLYFKYPNMEGESLKDVGISLTNPGAMLKLAEYLAIPDLILCRYPLYNPQTNTSIISMAFSAIVGALYADQGPKSARSIIHEVVMPQLAGQDLHDIIKLQHPKLMLYDLLRQQGKPRAVSRLLKEAGRTTHFPTFVVGVYSGGIQLGEGHGSSKKRAEDEAAKCALMKHYSKELRKMSLPSDLSDYRPEEQVNFSEEEDDELKEKDAV